MSDFLQSDEAILMFPQFEKYMREMEQRLQNQIDMQNEVIARKLERLLNADLRKDGNGHSELEEKLSDGQSLRDHVKNGFRHIGERLDSIDAAVGFSHTTNPGGDDEEDRKRLKERLKQALKKEQKKSLRKPGAEKKSWVEYIFGICKADGRIGKKGSRWYHEQLVKSKSASDIWVFRL
jgi:hypothetical protein